MGRCGGQSPLDPPHGIIYAGWTNHVRLSALALQAPEEREQGDIEVAAASDTIAGAFDASASPWLFSYSGMSRQAAWSPSPAWPGVQI